MAIRGILTTLLLLGTFGCQSPEEKAAAAFAEAQRLGDSDPGETLAQLRRVVALDPSLRAAHVRIAELELAAGRATRAEEAAREAIALREDADMRLLAARAAIARERWEAAEEDLSRAGELGADDEDVLPSLARAQAAQEKIDEALVSLDRASEARCAPDSLRPARVLVLRQLLARAESALQAMPEGTEPGEGWSEPEVLRQSRARAGVIVGLLGDTVDPSDLQRLEEVEDRVRSLIGPPPPSPEPVSMEEAARRLEAEGGLFGRVPRLDFGNGLEANPALGDEPLPGADVGAAGWTRTPRGPSEGGGCLGASCGQASQ